MKKISNLILIILLLIITNEVRSQKIEKTILIKGKSGWLIAKSISNDIDTVVYFYFGFQNQKYQHILDQGSIFITKKENLQLFLDKLSEYDLKKENVSITEVFSDFTLAKYNFSKSIYIIDNKGKYTITYGKHTKIFIDSVRPYVYLLK